jgi:AAA15 family ATPase/GTPase
MLIGFSCKNFKSFYEEPIFTMVARDDGHLSGTNTIPANQGDLLKSALIFGANSSGKTNFLSAIAAMKLMITSDPHLQEFLFSSGIFTFKFNENAENIALLMEIEFIAGDNFIYQYGFEILHGNINKENLLRRQNTKDSEFKELFIRTPSLVDKIKLSDEMKNVEKFVENLRPDTLFLYWANYGNNAPAMTVCGWLKGLNVCTPESTQVVQNTFEYINTESQNQKAVLEFLQLANPNLTGLTISQNPFASPAIFEKGEENKRIKRKNRDNPLDDIKSHYKLYDKDWNLIDGNKKIPFKLESAGTRRLMELLGIILNTLKNGGVILIDEIDTRLHPLLVRDIIRRFNSIHHNPKNAQLICTTHDALLLDEEIRHDQIYFTERDERGVSSLYSLSDFEGISKESKLLKNYLMGTFGAVPKLKDLLNYAGEEGIKDE